MIFTLLFLGIAFAFQAAAVRGDSFSPGAGELTPALQIWLRADALEVKDAQPVGIWPDESGNHRDLHASRGAVAGGIGLPGKFHKKSLIEGRPGVSFDAMTGYAALPADPVAINGDAELTMALVMNLQPSDDSLPMDCIFGIGEPANPTDPGKPLAAFAAINHHTDHALLFAGGWYHDATMGSASFTPLYGRSIILTIVKRPGPMQATTHFYINGEPAAELPAPASDSLPDIRHRSDIGAFMGKALKWAGSIRGDIGEVVLYNKALSDSDRGLLEGYLGAKFGIARTHPPLVAARAGFKPEELSYWAYQPIKNPAPPAVKNQGWCKSPIDRFVLARLEAAGLSPAGPADKATLLRRATFDLTGLPPTPEEIAAFEKDDSSAAFEHVVDRLLASPAYGVQWGRHWLDVVRYADTTANDANAVMRYAWRYRNYVIDAFNHDLPYDQFLVEQLAGDLLPTQDANEHLRRTIATGYLMIGPKALAETDKEQTRLDIADDQIDVTSRAILGLTVSCARCHDHKFDAIKTVDYYALVGIFRGAEVFQNEDRNASMWWEFPVNDADGKPVMVMAPKEAQGKDLRVHVRGSRYNLGDVARRGSPQIINPACAPIESSASGRLEFARWIANRQNPLTARVLVNRVWQHHFGRGIVASSDNFGVRGERPTHPELLDWLSTRFMENRWSIKALHKMILLSSTYQQAGQASNAAARDDPSNLLLSHFARQRLSAEQLRDSILAISGKLDTTMDNGESSAVLWDKAQKADDKGLVRPNRMAADDPYYTTCVRRSIYLPIVRNSLPDILALFDGADPNSVAAVRDDTTVPSQSLFMMNSPFVRGQARIFAERMLALPGTDADRIRQASLLTLGRAPSEPESTRAQDFILAYINNPAVAAHPQAERRKLAWESYCQILFCRNEFLYFD
jgi:hypothetical protein